MPTSSPPTTATSVPDRRSVPAVRRVTFGPVQVDYDERVLEPRPWTLLQSRWAARLAAGAAPGPVLEVCAGAGHIGLAAAVLADRDLVQVEADPVAAGYARANAARAGRAGRTEVRCTRLQEALAPGETFGVVLADPPYLPTDEVAGWPQDPVTAIDGGADGLDLVRACLCLAAAHLTADGVMLLQLAGPGQLASVGALCAPLGLYVAAGESVDAARSVAEVRRTPSASHAEDLVEWRVAGRVASSRSPLDAEAATRRGGG